MGTKGRDLWVAVVVLSVSLLCGGCGGGNSSIDPSRVGGQPTVLGEAVPVPAGVDAGLMSELATALESQLIAQGGRGISDVTGVYVDPLERADVISDVKLTWEYNNTGDYDQNSEVNVADLTPVGAGFGQTSADAGWDTAKVADGDGNGEINIADITPIGANFGSVVSNYVIEANVDGAGDWQPVANVPFSAGEVPPGGGLMMFTGWVPFGVQVPGAGADMFRVSAGPEQLPLYEFQSLGWSTLLSITPPSGYVPLEVQGVIHFYEDTGPFDVVLDFNDDSPNYTGSSPAGGDLFFTHTFASVGTFNVTGTVTNTGSLGGQLAIAQQVVVTTFNYQDVLTPDNWVEYKMEEGEQWGKHSAIALVDNKPVMVYTRDDRKEIYFARSTVERPTALSQWVQMVVDDADNLGGALGVAEVQGVPCVVYENTIDQDTYFASSGVAAPNAQLDWTSHEVDTGTPIRTGAQIADVHNKPALVYITGAGVRYAVSNQGESDLPTENNHWDYTDIDTDGFMEYPQIGVANFTPVVAYQRADSGWQEARYAWLDGATWHVVTVDDLNKNSGNSIRLRVVGSDPDPVILMAYQNVDIVSYLRYARCPVWNPANGGLFNTMTVRQQAQTHVGNWLGLAFFHIRPLMSYVNTGSGSTPGLQISYANTDSPTGPDDFEHVILDDPMGYFINEQTSALTLNDGTVFIVYRTSEGLKFAYFAGP